MKTKIWILIVLAAVFITLAALGLHCQPSSSEAPIDRETFVTLYVDLEMAAERAGIGTPKYERVRDSILTSHGTDFEEITAMLSAYDTEPEKWAEVWKEILAELDRRKAAASLPDSTAGN